MRRGYQIKRGDDLGDPDFWNKILEDVDLRLAAREQDGDKIDTAVEVLTQVALQRLNDTFTPVLQEALDKLASAGAFFEATSASEITLGLGAKSFVIDAANRTGWVVTDYVVISATDAPGVGMVANVLNYDRVSGIVEVDVLVVVGSGTYDSWRLRVSAPPDLEHATRTDNPHQTTAAQVGAYTTAQVDAALTGLTAAYNSAIAAAISALGLGTAAQKAVAFFATATQGAKADSALQSSDIGMAVLAPNGDGSALTGIASVPVGTTIYVNGTTAPAGTMKENGTLLARVGPYAKLWAYAQVSGNLVSEAAWSANRSAFSTGDGVSNFRIPDSRGLFIRGLDDGVGFDAGRTIGSYQDMMIQAHAHTVAYTPGNLAGGSGGNMIFGGGAEGATSSVGGPETRPRNVAKLACIKY